MKIILRNKTTNRLYFTTDAEVVTNIETGQSGRLTPEQMKEHFVIHVRLTNLIQKNEKLIDLIRNFKMQVEQ